MKKPQKTLTRFDKSVIIFNTICFAGFGVFSMWRNEYWLLKCWFSAKILIWAWDFVQEIYNDKTFIDK